MKCIEKEVFIPCCEGRPVFPGFVAYASTETDLLVSRNGWVDASDTYDDFADRTSIDGGNTWSPPVIRLQQYPVDNGVVRYIELAAFLDEEQNRFFTFACKRYYPGGASHVVGGARMWIEIQQCNPAEDVWPKPLESDFGFSEGIGISFSFPIKTASGKILVPFMKEQVDQNGSTVKGPQGNIMYQTGTIIGEYSPDGSISWKAGTPRSISADLSTRGLSESALCEISPGKIVMVARGSNAGAAETIEGCKWVCWSKDDGITWSDPVALVFDDGSKVPSSATGCEVFRSIRNGKLYFLGNIASSFDQVNGNWPRSPLVVAEIQENPFAIKRDTITVIDQLCNSESEYVQMSNFRYYQERTSGDIILFLARYGERKGLEDWKDADFYRYRIEL